MATAFKGSPISRDLLDAPTNMMLIPPLDFFARGILRVTVAIIFFNFFEFFLEQNMKEVIKGIIEITTIAGLGNFLLFIILVNI